MSIKSRIINDEFSDYHIHSVFSDGTATIEEIVQYAGMIGMKNIAITDHSDANLNFLIKNRGIHPGGGAMYSMKKRENVRNDVNVILGIEADVVDEKGTVCFEMQGRDREVDFCILALHRNPYLSDPETSTQGILQAIETYHDRIDCIGHPYDKNQNGDFIQIEPLVDLCNHYNIPMEFNYSTFVGDRAVQDNLIYMLKNAKSIYVNSDAHTLAAIRPRRKSCYDFIDSLE